MTIDTQERSTDLEPVDLGDIAAQGIGDSAAQGALIDAPEGQLVRFVGASYKDTDDTSYQLGEERTFTVRGKVVGQGDKIMADGHTRHEVAIRVESISPSGD